MDVTVHNNGAYLGLSSNGASHRFHAIWLRDNAWDPETRAPGNGQRLIALRDISAEVSITGAEVSDQFLKVTFAPEDKTITYAIDWLFENAYDAPHSHRRGWTPASKETWDGSTLRFQPQASKQFRAHLLPNRRG